MRLEYIKLNRALLGQNVNEFHCSITVQVEISAPPQMSISIEILAVFEHKFWSKKYPDFSGDFDQKLA